MLVASHASSPHFYALSYVGSSYDINFTKVGHADIDQLS